MDLLSLSFGIFLLIGTIVYYIIPGKVQWIWLLFLGMFFYVSSSLKLSVFILFSILISYLYARYFRNRTGLVIVIALTAGCLLFLKVCSGGGGLLASFLPLERFSLLLPLGISFYTLQIIGYCVDVYRKKTEPETNIFKYVLFVTFFPQILQGPIPRFDRLHKQFFVPHRFSYQKIVFALQLILWGLFQKMVIADRAAIVVNRLFGEYETYKGFYVLLAGVLYSIQLYADFAGCVSIAQGAAALFDIHLDDNFDHPYFAVSVKDFWRRWHISLSSWLKDYIYIPLGGNRHGNARKYMNIMITFLVSGVWHGIGLHYLVWGGLHGAYQCVGDATMPFREKLKKAMKMDTTSFSYTLFSQIGTFFLVMTAWIFFRASSVKMGILMIKNMFTVWNPYIFWTDDIYMLGLDGRNFRLLILSIFLLWGVGMLQQKGNLREWIDRQNLVFRWTIILAGILSILIFGIYGPGYDSAQFIYGAF